MRYQVQVPGKMMFAGEYSVLRGGRAIAATLDTFLKLTLKDDIPDANQTKVTSNLWQEPKWVVKKDDGAEYDHEPLLEAVHTCQNVFNKCPQEIVVESDLVVSHGVGSSSAVRLATCLAFEAFAQECQSFEGWESVRRAYVLQRAHQGRASGYDIATQYLGGVVAFRDESSKIKGWPTEAKAVADNAASTLNKYFLVFVGGEGAPTKDTIRTTHDWLAQKDNLNVLRNRNEALVDSIESLIEEENASHLQGVIKSMEEQRKCFEPSPTFPKRVGDRLKGIKGLGKKWSYKATGAGGEDAILVVCQPERREKVTKLFAEFDWLPLGVSFCNSGAKILDEEALDE